MLTRKWIYQVTEPSSVSDHEEGPKGTSPPPVRRHFLRSAREVGLTDAQPLRVIMKGNNGGNNGAARATCSLSAAALRPPDVLETVDPKLLLENPPGVYIRT